MNTGKRQDERQHPKRTQSRWDSMQKTDLSLAKLMDLLAIAKQAEGKTEKTIIWYRQAMRDYMRWLEENDLPTVLANFSLDKVRAYVVGLYERPVNLHHPVHQPGKRTLSDHYISSMVRALRAISNWLFAEQYIEHPPLARLSMPKVSKKVQDILCAEEIADIITSLNPRTEIGARDQALFLLLLDTGMRASELCGLKLPDVHLDQGYAVVFGKGKKERPVKIGARAAKALRFYLLHWRKAAMPAVQHVFLTLRGVTNDADATAPEPGMPMSVNALAHSLKRMGTAAGVPRLHAHLLRHTFACMYLMRYRDPFALKSLLGHTTLAMTNHYCEAVQQMDVVRADTVSVIDGLDLKLPDVNRRGRPAKKQKRG